MGSMAQRARQGQGAASQLPPAFPATHAFQCHHSVHAPPWSTWGHTHGHRGQDRAAGTPGSPHSPGAGFSVTSDWGTAGTKLLGKARRAELLCLGTLLLVPMGIQSSLPVGWAMPCAVHHSPFCLAPDSYLCPHTERKKWGTQPGCTTWLHTHTPTEPRIPPWC